MKTNGNAWKKLTIFIFAISLVQFALVTKVLGSSRLAIGLPISVGYFEVFPAESCKNGNTCRYMYEESELINTIEGQRFIPDADALEKILNISTNTRVLHKFCSRITTDTFSGEARIQVVPGKAMDIPKQKCITMNDFSESNWKPEVRYIYPHWQLYTGYLSSDNGDKVKLPESVAINLDFSIPLRNLFNIYLNVLPESIPTIKGN